MSIPQQKLQNKKQEQQLAVEGGLRSMIAFAFIYLGVILLYPGPRKMWFRVKIALSLVGSFLAGFIIGQV